MSETVKMPVIVNLLVSLQVQETLKSWRLDSTGMSREILEALNNMSANVKMPAFVYLLVSLEVQVAVKILEETKEGCIGFCVSVQKVLDVVCM